MRNALYTIGLDYGSLSCRGVLAGLDGSIAGEAEFCYPHGILDHALPDGTPLTGSWYLQHRTIPGPTAFRSTMPRAGSGRTAATVSTVPSAGDICYI